MSVCANVPNKKNKPIMKRKIALFTTLLALSGLALYTNNSAFAQTPPAPAPAPVVAHEGHPAIHAAIRALERAKVDLKNAAHDFGGHREAALQACDNAIAQLKLALQFDKQ
jgi:hypothetical protein